MSRKTRKLIWSAPLVAVLAVAGTLAVFVMLAPGGVLAHEPGAGIAPHLPPGPVTGIDVTTPTIEDGGRTSLRVSWNAPTDGDDPTMYRVDVSTDTDVWNNVIGGEASDDEWTEAEAMDECTSDDEGNRCYTATGLKSDTLYHFRVFAMNDFGTSPISIGPAPKATIESGETLRIDPPAKATGLEATDYYTDKIVVSWRDVVDTGGADVLWYCVGVASSPSGPFVDLTHADYVTDCLRAMEEMDADDVAIAELLELDGDTYMSQTAVVAAKDENGDPVTSFTHDGLGGGDHDDETNADLPHEIELRYRLYAVTDEDGKASTPGDRWIARAASEVATGSTMRPADKPAPQSVAPLRVGNLRAVAYTTDNTDGVLLEIPDASDQGLHFFWTHPTNYDPANELDDDMETEQPWMVQVQRRVPNDQDHEDYSGWQFVTGSALIELADGYGTPQFTVNFAATANVGSPATYAAPTLWAEGASSRTYRVRYINRGDDLDADATDDDVKGAWREITIPEITTGYYRNEGAPDATSTLPIILQSAMNRATGLRFEHNDDSPREARDNIDLLWDRDDNARATQNQPNGYVIDRSANGGVTWQVLTRADAPNDLGTAATFTDSPGTNHKVIPGKHYVYRVFPVFIVRGPDAYGVPAVIDASSRGADLPAGVRNLDVDAAGQTAFDLSWRAPADNGGHEIKGYLIEMALDADGEPGDWETIEPEEDDDAPLTVKGKDTTTYKYNPMTGGDPPAPMLSAGSTRWFRVIAITNENDGDRSTGGTQVGVTEGEPISGDLRSPDETLLDALPSNDDAERATPEDGTTDGLGDAPADQAQAPPQMPVDLTAEAASDTNSLADSNRGVFLTWNEVAKGDASETASYRIERIRMNTGVDALNNDADDWQFLTRVFDVTSWTDDTGLREATETRMYQVCSEATGITTPACVDMAVDYELHPEMHDAAAVEFSAPTNVAATSSGGTITLTWTPGARAVSQIAIVVNLADDTDYCLSMVLAGDVSSYECTERTVGASYAVLVIALDDEGGYMLGKGADDMIVMHVAE